MKKLILIMMIIPTACSLTSKIRNHEIKAGITRLELSKQISIFDFRNQMFTNNCYTKNYSYLGINVISSQSKKLFFVFKNNGEYQLSCKLNNLNKYEKLIFIANGSSDLLDFIDKYSRKKSHDNFISNWNNLLSDYNVLLNQNKVYKRNKLLNDKLHEMSLLLNKYKYTNISKDLIFKKFYIYNSILDDHKQRKIDKLWLDINKNKSYYNNLSYEEKNARYISFLKKYQSLEFRLKVYDLEPPKFIISYYKNNNLSKSKYEYDNKRACREWILEAKKKNYDIDKRENFIKIKKLLYSLKSCDDKEFFNKILLLLNKKISLDLNNNAKSITRYASDFLVDIQGFSRFATSRIIDNYTLKSLLFLHNLKNSLLYKDIISSSVWFYELGSREFGTQFWNQYIFKLRSEIGRCNKLCENLNKQYLEILKVYRYLLTNFYNSKALINNEIDYISHHKAYMKINLYQSRRDYNEVQRSFSDLISSRINFFKTQVSKYSLYGTQKALQKLKNVSSLLKTHTINKQSSNGLTEEYLPMNIFIYNQ